MSTTNIEVKKNGNENGMSLVRRFSRRMQESGIIINVKKNRYVVRKPSKLVKKTGALKRLKKRKEMDALRKMGKVK